MPSSFEEAVSRVKKNGLPSKEEMREGLNLAEAADFQETVQAKLSSYKKLFSRFESGEDLEKEELREMIRLSEELRELGKRIGKTLDRE